MISDYLLVSNIFSSASYSEFCKQVCLERSLEFFWTKALLVSYHLFHLAVSLRCLLVLREKALRDIMLKVLHTISE